ncbi:MAG: hypothetical protein IKA30_05470 [Alphaproteobacteria bacterium]|nr:hypothetical protein [Alphaproteobacteria bacterium]
MKKMLLLAGIAMIGLTGCSSVHQGVASGALQTTVSADHVANIKVGEKISGESSAKILFGFIKIGGDNNFVDGMSYAGESSGLGGGLPLPIPSVSSGMDSVKSAAAYKALTNSGADVIVAPTYKTTVKNDYVVYKELEAKVEGYKGTITGFTQKK